jgi:hypothetical protein
LLRPLFIATGRKPAEPPEKHAKALQETQGEAAEQSKNSERRLRCQVVNHVERPRTNAL